MGSSGVNAGYSIDDESLGARWVRPIEGVLILVNPDFDSIAKNI
jgi:hypothetical protein